MVNTNDSENKQIVREELADFIRKNYSQDSLRNMRVLTLLGQQPYELETIWDKIGVKRSNITTVEKNLEVRERIKSNFEGVRVIDDYDDINDFIANTNEKFDIINLDYCGIFSIEQFQAIQDISSKKILGDKGILATWYSGRREQEDVQKFLKAQYLSALYSVIALTSDDTATQAEKEIAQNIFEKRSKLSKSELERSDTITNTLTKSLTFPASKMDLFDPSRDFPEIIKLLGKEKRIVEAIENGEIYKSAMKQLLDLSKNENQLREKVGENIAQHYLKIRRKAVAREPLDFEDRLNMARYFMGTIESMHEMRKVIATWVKHEIANKSIKFDIKNSLLLENIAHILLYQNPNYLIFDNERSFYHGDNGTPMFVDFMLVGKKEFKDFSWYNKNGKIKLNFGTLSHFGYREFNRFLDYLSTLRATSIIYMKNRNIIDSESGENKITENPVLNLETITQDDSDNKNHISNIQSETDTDKIKEMLINGISYEAIKALYPNVTNKQLGAYSAWNKMKLNPDAPRAGRKKKTDIMPENISVDSTVREIEDVSADTQRIVSSNKKYKTLTNAEMSKDEALMFINEGYSPEEIASVFNVNVWQIRGYVAGQTRKQNKEKEYQNK
jgi:hypothetical protein